MTSQMFDRRVDGFGNIIVPDYPSVDTLMKIGNPENSKHHDYLCGLMHSAHCGRDAVYNMMNEMNDMHGGAWYDDLWEGIKDVGKFLWDNKKDILDVAKAVAPLVGMGRDFDDAYDEVVGGAMSRFARKLPDLKHYDFNRLERYIKMVNNMVKNKTATKQDMIHINAVRKLFKARTKQQTTNPKLFSTWDKKRLAYSKQHYPKIKPIKPTPPKASRKKPRYPSAVLNPELMLPIESNVEYGPIRYSSALDRRKMRRTKDNIEYGPDLSGYYRALDRQNRGELEQKQPDDELLDIASDIIKSLGPEARADLEFIRRMVNENAGAESAIVWDKFLRTLGDSMNPAGVIQKMKESFQDFDIINRDNILPVQPKSWYQRLFGTGRTKARKTTRKPTRKMSRKAPSRKAPSRKTRKTRKTSSRKIRLI